MQAVTMVAVSGFSKITDGFGTGLAIRLNLCKQPGTGHRSGKMQVDHPFTYLVNGFLVVRLPDRGNRNFRLKGWVFVWQAKGWLFTQRPVMGLDWLCT